MRVKFYMCEFKHKQSGRMLHKFGITRHMDVMDRFSTKESERFSRSVHQYDDFAIRVLASYVCEDGTQARAIERDFLNMYPKAGLVVESALGESFGRYDDMSGVTELRKLSPSQLSGALRKIYNMIGQGRQGEFKAKKKKYLMDQQEYSDVKVYE